MVFDIAIIGPIPRDRIITHKGEEFKKYGCVTHPVIGISKLLNGSGTVYPISHVEEKDQQPIRDLFADFDSIDSSGVTSKNDRGDVIQLNFLDQNRRSERQTGYMDPILPVDLDPFLHCKAFVFIPITDFEISLDTLRHIKAKSDAPIIFDAHGPTNGVSVQGSRFPKPWIDRDQWLPYIDVLKMNREEAFCCWWEELQGEVTTEERPEASQETMDKLADHCLSNGVKAVCITMDSRGSLVYHGGKKELVPPIKVGPVVDTTGAGDSFAGGLAYGYLYYKDYFKAARFANLLGARRTQGSTFDVFLGLKESEKLILEQYGD